MSYYRCWSCGQVNDSCECEKENDKKIKAEWMDKWIDIKNNSPPDGDFIGLIKTVVGLAVYPCFRDFHDKEVRCTINGNIFKVQNHLIKWMPYPKM